MKEEEVPYLVAKVAMVTVNLMAVVVEVNYEKGTV